MDAFARIIKTPGWEVDYMATDPTTRNYGRKALQKWHIGVGSGIAAVIPMILFSNLIGGKELFPLFGLIPFAVLWGLIYAGIASIDRIEQMAVKPATGAGLGIVYGFVVWWGPQLGKPVEEIVSVNGAIQVFLFGLVLGLIYAYSSELSDVQG